jgi:hypothetical protein
VEGNIKGREFAKAFVCLSSKGNEHHVELHTMALNPERGISSLGSLPMPFPKVPPHKMAAKEFQNDRCKMLWVPANHSTSAPVLAVLEVQPSAGCGAADCGRTFTWRESLGFSPNVEER